MHLINSYRFRQACLFIPERLYSCSEIDDLINIDGYVPVASITDLNNLRNSINQEMGAGSEWVGNYDTGLNKKYVQVRHIDATTISNFTPIGSFANQFSGTFDGANLDITNLTINQSFNYVGLFGTTSTSSNVKNLKVSGSVTGLAQTGGIVGQSFNLIDNCHFSGTVTGSNNTGGVIGSSNNTITNCSSSGTVTGVSLVGGLVGLCVAISNSNSSSNIIATGQGAGGLIGRPSANVTECYSTGNVTSTARNVGGLIGECSSSGSNITRCYATGNVDGTTAACLGVGGFIGDNTGNITDCYATGNIDSYGTYSASFVGVNRGNITNSYGVGSVSANGAVYLGFNGLAVGGSNINSSYWDTITTGQSTSAGGTGKTTTEMQQGTIPDTTIYVGWSASIWDEIDTNNYPELVVFQ